MNNEQHQDQAARFAAPTTADIARGGDGDAQDRVVSQEALARLQSAVQTLDQDGRDDASEVIESAREVHEALRVELERARV